MELLDPDEGEEVDAEDGVEDDAEEVAEDTLAVEDWVDGSGENESDTLGLATLQNCWARLSVFAS